MKNKTWLRRLALVFLGLLLGVNVYLFNARSLAGNQLPMPLGFGAAVVQSGSMEPTLSTGDLLFVRRQEEYSVGDIVVYQSQGILVVHRIIAAYGQTLITQGDANDLADQPFDLSCVKGAVVGSVPVVGYVIDFMKTPKGILLLVGCAVVLVELSFYREKQAEQERRARRIQGLCQELRQLRQEINRDEQNTEN